MSTQLDPHTFDAMVKPRVKRERPTWTLPAIGNLIGVGPDFIRTLAKVEGAPIHRVAGQWFAYESELVDWMKSRPT